jgi:hypothetical protein
MIGGYIEFQKRRMSVLWTYDFLYTRISSRDYYEFIQRQISVLRNDEVKQRG